MVLLLKNLTDENFASFVCGSRCRFIEQVDILHPLCLMYNDPQECGTVCHAPFRLTIVTSIGKRKNCRIGRRLHKHGENENCICQNLLVLSRSSVLR